MLGAYPGYRGSIQTAASNVGLSTLPFAMGFGDNATAAAESSGAAAFAQWATAAGSRLIWGFTMLPNDGSVTLAQCATGAMNATAVSCAQALVANGQANAIWRIGWEMNGSWFLWGLGSGGPVAGQYANYIAAVRQIVTAARSVSGQNFLFCGFNPTLFPGQTDTSIILNAYPGDAYTDIVGLDLYDQIGSFQYPGYQAAWNYFLSPSSGELGLNWLTSFAQAHGKQIGLFEWGLGFQNYDPSNVGLSIDDPTFANNSAQWAVTNNVFIMSMWDDPVLGSTPHLGDTSAPLSNAAIRSNLNLSIGANAGVARVALSAKTPTQSFITRSNASAFPLPAAGTAQSTVGPLTLGEVNDLLLVGVKINSTSVTVSGVAAPGLSFASVNRYLDSANGVTTELWYATVPPAVVGTSVTPSVSFSASVASTYVEIVADLLAAGPNVAWTLPSLGGVTSGASTTISYPSITSASGTVKQAYWGFGGCNTGSATGGSTAGFTYATTGDGDQIVFDGALAASTVYAPTGTCISSTITSVGVILSASSVTPGTAKAGVAGLTAAALAPNPASPHVMLIMMENQQKSNIYGSPNAPYLQSLAGNYPTATDFWATDHPSLPNYLELWTGADQGVVDDNPPSSHSWATPTTIGKQLDSASIPWGAYFESLGTANPAVDEGPSDGSSQYYVVHHNPLAYTGEASLSQDFSAMIPALNQAQPPQFVFVVPDILDDMHDPSGSTSAIATAVSTGDNWLSSNIPAIQATKWYALGGIILIIWDEAYDSTGTNPVSGGVGTAGQANGGPVAMFMVAKNLLGIPPLLRSSYGLNSSGQYATAINHAGILRGIENLFRVSLLADAATSGNGDLSAFLTAALSPPVVATLGKGNVACSANNATVQAAQTNANAGRANVSVTAYATIPIAVTASFSMSALNASVTGTNGGVPAGLANVSMASPGALLPIINRSTASSFPVGNAGSDISSVSGVTLGNAGDFVLVGMSILSTSITVSSVTATGLTFGLMGRYIDTVNGHDLELWSAAVPTWAAGTTVTVSITTSASTVGINVEIEVDELTTPLGTTTAWGSSAPTGTSTATASTNMIYPSLTSYPQARGQSYWAFGISPNNARAGSDAGFTWSSTIDGNDIVFDGTLVPSTGYQPTGTQDSAAGSTSIGIIIAANQRVLAAPGVAAVHLGAGDIQFGSSSSIHAGVATVSAAARPITSRGITLAPARSAAASVAARPVTSTAINIGTWVNAGLATLTASALGGSLARHGDVDFRTAPPVLRWATRPPESRWSTSPIVSVD